MAIHKIVRDKELPRSTIQYSQYQTDIFGTIENQETNLIIEAVAGSGKTTTIVDACRLLDKKKEHIFLAFNKAIADELSTKVPYHVAAKTMHSLCLGILRNNYKKVKVSANRVGNLLYTELGCKGNSRMRDYYYEHKRDVCNIIGRCKAQARDVVTPEVISQLIDDLGLDIEDNKYVHELIMKIFYMCIEFDGDEHKEIDFDDMIYHCVMRGHVLDYPMYDTVIVDEAQDLNMCQRYLLTCIKKQNGRLIAVGDTRQSIYGFRGADHQSMRAIKDEFQCTELPLSITYRCSRAVTELAKHYVPEIECRKDAPDGLVSRVLLSDFRFMVQSGDYILCRTWAPLMREAMKLGRNGHNVCILGKDLAPSLTKWVKDIGNQYDSINRSTVWDHFNLMAAGVPEKQEWKTYAMKDKAQTIAYICGNSVLTTAEVTAVIKEIFSDKPPVVPHVLLSTIHRVKGGEADRVFILRPDLLPHPLAQGHNELVQEENLHYVAITRAREQLWYIEEED